MIRFVLLAALLLFSALLRAESELPEGFAEESGKSAQSAFISHDDMVLAALSLIGSPYKYGGDNPDTGFDCSGLVKYVLGLTSPIVLPRSSHEMYSDGFGHKIAVEELKAGDLLFFRIGKSKRVNHVAVYIGENRFVHAPATGGFVRVDKMGDKYWTRYFLGAKRVLPENDMSSAEVELSR